MTNLIHSIEENKDKDGEGLSGDVQDGCEKVGPVKEEAAAADETTEGEEGTKTMFKIGEKTKQQDKERGKAEKEGGETEKENETAKEKRTSAGEQADKERDTTEGDKNKSKHEKTKILIIARGLETVTYSFPLQILKDR